MKGVGKGNTNNWNGRPAGANQKLSFSVREKIVEAVTTDFDNYMVTLKSLDNRDYVRCMTELIKLVVPRPLNEEESNSANINNEFIKRLFNK